MMTNKLKWSIFGLALAVTAGCDGPDRDDRTRHVVLKFTATVGDEAAQCGRSYSGLGITGVNVEILDMRLYVSRVRLINAEGDEVPLTLDQDGKWQVDDVVLLDFEDGTGKCADSGNSDVRSEVRGTVPDGSYQGVVFDLGVPFALNHNDLTAAPAPLNVSALFWTWAVGRQFVHINIETEVGRQWDVHLGSTMCVSGGPADPPVTDCGRPNRPRITLASFNPDEDTIELDLHSLLATSDLMQDTPDSGTGCQSFPDDVNECTPLFQTLGMDFATGQCLNGCANQTVFRVHHGKESNMADQETIARGMLVFSSPHLTTAGETLACGGCHGNEGRGAEGPDIRDAAASHLIEHSQGDGPHPKGVKFTSLTAADYDDIAAFLASICMTDPDCMPGSVDEHGHDEDGE